MPDENTENKGTKIETTDHAAENAKLKATLAAISPKLDRLEADEAKRIAAEKKREEDRRKKDEGAETILAEKAKELETAQQRIAAYESRERERVNATYETLPEALRESITAMQDKLPLSDWAELVEKQRAAAEKLTGKARPEEGEERGSDATGVFLHSGTARRQVGHEVSAKAAEILENTGHGLEHAESLTIKRETDPESGQKVVKFSKQFRQFFADMPRPTLFKVLGTKGITPTADGGQKTMHAADRSRK